MNSYLVDANVWLAISHNDHAHHLTALRWLDEADGVCCFCRITQLALLRLLTNSKVMGLSVKTQADAWKIYEALIERDTVVLVGEPSLLDREFANYRKVDIVHRTPGTMPT
jgi:predicted nucleic acid-binding protein